MTMKLYESVTGDGLFDILGKAFHAIDTLNTARLTTVPTEVEDFLEQVELIANGALEYGQTVDGVASAVTSWQSGGGTLTNAIRSACERILIQFVADDADPPDSTLSTALEYLLEQMDDGGYYVDANAVTLTLLASGENDNDVTICYSDHDGYGREVQNALAEVVQLDVISATSATNPVIEFRGEEAISDKLSEQWPQGSGCYLAISATDASSSLLSNGDFEDAEIDNIPDDWIIVVGNPGVTVFLTDPEQQTAAISGTPTGGTYVLSWTNAAGVTRATAAIDYDADAAAVQSALQAIPGLEQVTIESSGTSPNYTHTITFTGVGGTVEQLTSLNYLTGGVSPTISHATTVPGDDGSFNGRALCLQSNGSEQTAVYHALSLTAETVYFCHFRIARRASVVEESSDSSQSSASSASVSESSESSSSQSESESSGSSASSLSQSSQSSSSDSSMSESSPSSSSSSQSAEELRIEIVDGIDGSVLVDNEGNEAALRVDLGTLAADGHAVKWFAFALARAVQQPVYLRIRFTAPPAAGTGIYLDEMALVQGTQLYAGGPYAAVFSGIRPAVEGDQWDLTIANNRAGILQTWFDRIFQMSEKGFLLATEGASLIPDSVVG